MKKILTILAIAATSLLSAYGDSDSKTNNDSAKPSYDFSTEKSLVASFIEQGKKEGFDEKETFRIFKKYNKAIETKYEAEITKLRAEGKDNDKFIEKYTQGVTFAEMKKFAEDTLNEEVLPNKN